MKSGAGHSKGASFEREVSRRLSLWLSNGERDDLLWRSSMSGGLATLQLKKDKKNLTQSGDLSAIGEGAYEFCEKHFVECKFYNDLSLSRSLICGTGGLFTFWRVACREARKYHKLPLLVVRQNRFPTLALTRSTDHIFDREPLMVHNWMGANVYLFDDVTSIRTPLRRGNG
jgi:hypothetical protein